MTRVLQESQSHRQVRVSGAAAPARKTVVIELGSASIIHRKTVVIELWSESAL